MSKKRYRVKKERAETREISVKSKEITLYNVKEKRIAISRKDEGTRIKEKRFLGEKEIYKPTEAFEDIKKIKRNLRNQQGKL